MHLTEAQVNAGIVLCGPRKTLESHLLLNNEQIHSSADAWEIVRERTMLVDALVKYQLRTTTQKVLGYDPVEEGEFPFRFGFFAVGGYGRGELSPNSDIDIRLVIDSPSSKENPLAKAFQHDVIYTFPESYGLKVDAQIHNLSDIPGFRPIDLNSFLEMRLLRGHGDLKESIKRTLREQGNLSGLFLHNLRLLEELRKKHPEDLNNVGFNVKYGYGGLRHYHASLWIEAAESFLCSRDLTTYRNLSESMRNSVGFLLKTRAELNLKRLIQSTPDPEQRARNLLRGHRSLESDVLKFKDYEELGASARERLIEARKNVLNFAEEQIKSVLKRGHVLGDYLITHRGIHVLPKVIKRAGNDPKEKTKIFLSLARTAQTNGLPINDTVQQSFYAGAHQWIRPDPLFGRLFYDPGRRSEILEDLARRNVLQKLIPGLKALEAGMYPENHRAHHLTKWGFALEKIKTKEKLIGEQSPALDLVREYKNISPDEDAAIELALVIKHVPKSHVSRGVMKDHDIRSYLELLTPFEFSQRTLNTVQFLIENHPHVSYDALSKRQNNGLKAHALAKIVETPENLRVLYIFAHADYGIVDDRKTALWRDLQELYRRTMNVLTGEHREASDHSNRFDTVGRNILDDIDPEFKSGRYGDTINYWIPVLSKVLRSKQPVVQPFTNPDHMIGVACEDYRGLLAVITGALLRSSADLIQAHACSLKKNNLALDMFEYAPQGSSSDEIIQRVKKAITERHLIRENPFKILEKTKCSAKVYHHPESSVARKHQYTLEFSAEQNIPGTVYALTRVLYDCEAKANISGINAYAYLGKPVNNSVFFSSRLRPGKVIPLLENLMSRRKN